MRSHHDFRVCVCVHIHTISKKSLSYKTGPQLCVYIYVFLKKSFIHVSLDNFVFTKHCHGSTGTKAVVFHLRDPSYAFWSAFLVRRPLEVNIHPAMNPCLSPAPKR